MTDHLHRADFDVEDLRKCNWYAMLAGKSLSAGVFILSFRSTSC